MENCIVKKEKSIVDNNMLAKMDEIVIGVSMSSDISATYRRIRVTNPLEDFTVMCLEGNYLSINQSLTNPTNIINRTAAPSFWDFYLLDGNYTIIINKKYSIELLELQGATISKSVYTFDFNLLDYDNSLKNISLPNTNSKGNISYVNDDIVQIYAGGTNLYGNIEDLSRCIALTNLDVGSGTKSNPYLVGELTTMFNKMAVNRSSGNIRIYVRNTAITLNGVTPSNGFDVRFGSSMVNPTEQETAQGWQTY